MEEQKLSIEKEIEGILGMQEPAKMKGAVAQLIRRAQDGTRIDSRIVFRPTCDWWITPLRDYLAETVYTDFGEFIKEFGEETARKVTEGEVIEVEREAPPHLEFHSCEYRGQHFVKVDRSFRGGSEEDLMREDLAKKFGYIK